MLFCHGKCKWQGNILYSKQGQGIVAEEKYVKSTAGRFKLIFQEDML